MTRRPIRRKSRLPRSLPSRILLGGLVLATLAGGCSEPDGSREATDAPSAETADTLDFSFVFFGCNRVGFSPSVPSPSTANVAQLEQTVRDIAALDVAPRYLFMLGDLVRNEQQDDGSTLEQQLADWQTLWDSLASELPETRLVPVPGNHEVLYSTKVHLPEGCDCDADPGCSCRYDEFPNPDAYPKWLEWLSAHGHDALAGNGPTPEGDPEDQLVLEDSDKLTYSFRSDLADGRQAHFVLVDTDALSSYRASDPACIQDAQNKGQPVPGWMPAHWVAQDISAAEADPAVEMIFALGHKPVQGRDGGRDPKGRGTVFNCPDAALADQFVGALEGHGKVAGYLTAHDHAWWHAQIGGVEQIVAGNAGSPPDPGVDSFGFTLVEIFTSGKVVATSYDRPVPDPIDDPSGARPAEPATTVTLR